MDYAGALQYLYSFVDWERGIGFGVGAPPRFTLDRIRALLRILENPHLRFSSVHIAGSKGKGSTAAIVESILRAAGSRTGLYTQPHLHTFRERVRVDNVPVEPEVFARLVERVAVAVESLNAAQPNLGKPTTYELATALGFLCFAEAVVDVAVVEVGLGGRLDATNVLTPLVSVVTSISLEHTAILGDTLAAVAREKAGIIKEGGVLVHAPNPAAVERVFQEVCAERRARLIAAEANRCEPVADPMTDDSSAPVCSYVRPEPVAGPFVYGSTGSPRTDHLEETDHWEGTGHSEEMDHSEETGHSEETDHLEVTGQSGETGQSEETDNLEECEVQSTYGNALQSPPWNQPVQVCKVYTLGEVATVRFPLRGRHQRLNLSVVLAVIDELASQGVPLSIESVCEGIEAVGWPGRFEQLSAWPLVIADGAHTPDAMACLRETLVEHYPGRRVLSILGTNKDKDIGLLLDDLLPAIDMLIVAKSRHPRARDPSEVTKAVRGRVPVIQAQSVEQAVSIGLDAMGADDVLCATGSLFVAAEAREAFGLADHIDPPLNF